MRESFHHAKRLNGKFCLSFLDESENVFLLRIARSFFVVEYTFNRNTGHLTEQQVQKLMNESKTVGNEGHHDEIYVREVLRYHFFFREKNTRTHKEGGGNALMHELFLFILFYFFSCYFLSFLRVLTGFVKASPANVAGILLFGHELSISVEIT